MGKTVPRKLRSGAERDLRGHRRGTGPKRDKDLQRFPAPAPRGRAGWLLGLGKAVPTCSPVQPRRGALCARSRRGALFAVGPASAGAYSVGDLSANTWEVTPEPSRGLVVEVHELLDEAGKIELEFEFKHQGTRAFGEFQCRRRGLDDVHRLAVDRCRGG